MPDWTGPPAVPSDRRAAPFSGAGRGLVRTDGGRLAYGATCGVIHDPLPLADDLTLITGVVEHGLFLDLPDEAIIGTESGVDVLVP